MTMTRKIMYMLMLLFTLMSLAVGQVTISPTSLFLSSHRRFETILIMNTSAVAQEVKLSWQFGYPKASEAGDVSYIYGDTLKAAEYSVAEWIRSFPKNFILEPGARQTVRVTVKPPHKLQDGTYWCRLKTTSSPVSPPVGSPQPGSISTNISFQFNQITGVFYQTGDLNTGIQITGVRHSINDQNLRVITDYKKSGNSPFLGSLRVKIFDAVGEIVKDEKVLVSIYFDGLRRLDLDISNLPMGSYEYEVSYSSGRVDILDSDIVSAPTVSLRDSFTKL